MAASVWSFRASGIREEAAQRGQVDLARWELRELLFLDDAQVSRDLVTREHLPERGLQLRGRHHIRTRGDPTRRPRPRRAPPPEYQRRMPRALRAAGPAPPRPPPATRWSHPS